MSARLRLAGLLALLLLLAGCAHRLPPAPADPPSVPADSGELAARVATLDLAEDESVYRLVAGSEAAFVHRMSTAAKASAHLDLQYYLWHDDLTGRLLAGELLAAAERGVRVRVLIDDLQHRGMDARLLPLDAHPNLEIRLFNPFRSRASLLGNAVEFIGSGGRQNHRMHNKLWIADGRIALVGGRNIGDEYFGAHTGFNFDDLGVLLAGAAVREAAEQFERYWDHPLAVPLTTLARPRDRDRVDPQPALDAHRREAQDSAYVLRLREQAAAGAFELTPETLFRGRQVRMIADDPDKALGRAAAPRQLRREIGELLVSTQTELLLVSPYFVPGRRGSAALIDVAGHARVRVLTNALAANDVAAVHGGYSRWRPPLLAAGIELYELRPTSAPPRGSLGRSQASLHSKALVADRTRSYIGSFNFDPRSARINTENGVLIDDPAFTAELLRQLEPALEPARSWQVTLRDGRLRWDGTVDGRPVQHRRDPEASFGRRFTALLFRWLPFDSQL